MPCMGTNEVNLGGGITKIVNYMAFAVAWDEEVSFLNEPVQSFIINNEAHLSWKLVTGATYYYIYNSDNPDTENWSNYLDCIEYQQGIAVYEYNYQISSHKRFFRWLLLLFLRSSIEIKDAFWQKNSLHLIIVFKTSKFSQKTIKYIPIKFLTQKKMNNR